MTQGETAQEQWTVGRLLSWTSEYFKSKGLESPMLCAQLLLAQVLECSKVDLYLRFEQVVDQGRRDAYRQLVKRAVEGEPIAYLTGHKEFFSLDFHVNRSVLIPRPETEVLVQWIIRRVRTLWVVRTEPLRILDVGTGSGGIAIALAKHLPKPAKIVAIDKSKAALDVCRCNIEMHKVEDMVTVLESDLFSGIVGAGPFDFIVSNPPYVTEEDYARLPRHIKDFEPREALVAAEGGLAVIRRIVAEGGKYLAAGGYVVMEIGYNQRQAVAELLAEHGYEHVEFEVDTADIARVAIGQKKE